MDTCVEVFFTRNASRRGSSKRSCHRAGGPVKTRGRREGEVAVLGRRRRSGAGGPAGSASFPCGATVSPRESTHSVNSLVASRTVSLGSFGSGGAEQNGDRHQQDATQGQERVTECSTRCPRESNGWCTSSTGPTDTRERSRVPHRGGPDLALQALVWMVLVPTVAVQKPQIATAATVYQGGCSRSHNDRDHHGWQPCCRGVHRGCSAVFHVAPPQHMCAQARCASRCPAVAVLLYCTPGTAAIQRAFSPLLSVSVPLAWCGLWTTGSAACDPFASRRCVSLRCLAQDEPAFRRQSGRDWIPDGTSYFSDGGGCRPLSRKPRLSAKLPPSMRSGC